MVSMEAPRDVTHRQNKHWSAVAGGWSVWFDWTERNFEPLTAWLLGLTASKAATRILDVGCGAGYPAITLAKALGVGSRIVATDLSPEMIQAASRRASATGLRNIEFVQCDAEDLRFDDHSFDVVTNADGLMFCPDPSRALAEAFRVLVSGGQIALATWDAPSKSPFFTVIRDVAATVLALREPRCDEPHPFRLSSAERLRSLLDAAGFSATEVESVPMTFECQSPLEYCQMFTDLAWGARVGALPPQEQARFREGVVCATRPYADRERLRLVATSLRVSARR